MSMRVFVGFADTALRGAVIKRIATLDGFDVRAGKPSVEDAPALVVLAVGDASPAECLGYRASGITPIVLAALPGAWQRETYERTGTVYLTMDVDAKELIAAIERAATASADR
jgi:hypothetical protein